MDKITDSDDDTCTINALAELRRQREERRQHRQQNNIDQHCYLESHNFNNDDVENKNTGSLSTNVEMSENDSCSSDGGDCGGD